MNFPRVVICCLRRVLIPCLMLVLSPASFADSPNMVFILDVSGSMGAKMGEQTKMVVAKQAFGQLVTELPDDAHVGLFVYGHHGNRDCEAMEMLVPIGELDRAAIGTGVKGLTASQGATPLTGALMLSVQALGNYRRTGGKAIVLISDGEETCNGDPVDFATQMTAGLKGAIKIYVIGLGVNAEQQRQLASIAAAGGGEYFGAADAAGLSESLKAIQSTLIKRNLFVEEFDGPGLKPGLVLLNEDDSGRVLDDGKLMLLTMPGDLQGGTLKNILTYSGPEAEGDFDLTLDVAMDFTAGPFQTHQSVGLMLFQPESPGNRIVLYIAGRGMGDGDLYRAYFKKYSNGSDQGSQENALGPVGEQTAFQLRLEKRGYRYVGYVKPDGADDWAMVGNQSFLGKKLVPGIYVWRNPSYPEVLVEIDRFQVDSIEPLR
jgi:hypothetical protein